MLGVSGKPSRLPEKKMKSSSKFLLDVYKFLKDDDGNENRIRKRSVLTLSADILDKVHTSDIIVSLNNVQRKSKGKYEKLVFSLKNFPEAKALIGAELRLYQAANAKTYRSHSMYQISVYKPFETIMGPIKLKKVAEKITASEYVGWISIDISYLFRLWLKTKRSLEEIYISAFPYGLSESEALHSSLIGLVLNSDTSENQPFIVSFLQNNNTVNLRLPRHILTTKNYDLTDILSGMGGICEVYPYKVSFKELMWHDWIIAPAGFTTSFCEGRCKFPLKWPIQATNHAIMQSLIRLKMPGTFPEPRCAPTHLDPLTILYREGENTILKKYNDMLVSGCSCQ
ncbi:hypothetical protein GWI33_015462 [Rhynchophorus ferrugineus]|uniref:TGF-beta family profile domain-containing protein n=1 Tax=Rhynchophorus ferrugineus TaxID=354439 RepID=A0A834MBD9_RHYFE|nr:hypothetical protein GWI33_015462 [Rhynchophorus ferrugineus]